MQHISIVNRRVSRCESTLEIVRNKLLAIQGELVAIKKAHPECHTVKTYYEKANKNIVKISELIEGCDSHKRSCGGCVNSELAIPIKNEVLK